MVNQKRAEKCQSWIKEIKSYQKKAPAIYNQGVKKNDSNFDVNHYFEILDNIELEKGWSADYLYLKDKLGGGPIIIAYPKSRKEKYMQIISNMHNSEEETMSKDYNSRSMMKRFLDRSDVDNYLKHIVLDGSEESYFQFVILAKLGSQFSLFWHAAYNDLEFLCTKAAAEKVIARIGREDEEISTIENNLFDKKTIKKIRGINFEPEIDIRNDKTSVRLVFFTKWGGFVEAEYLISKKQPNQIVEENTVPLVEYDCGYVY